MVKGFRGKLFLLFFVMGAIPLMLLVAISAYMSINEMEEAVKANSLLRNAVISEHITELIEKNQAVLKSLAMSPNVLSYLQEPTPEKKAYVEKILRDTDKIFEDGNLTALTGAEGMQLIRTDGSKLVDLTQRQHFQEAMKGRSYVSNIIVSMSTGDMIIVLEVPVLDNEKKSVGMIQRNFNLAALQDYIRNLDDSEVSVIIMDRSGRIIADSEEKMPTQDTSYKFILDRVYNSTGFMAMEIGGEEMMASYSRNIETGWMIVTLRPYSHIFDEIYGKALRDVALGFILLILTIGVSKIFSRRVSKPIEAMTQVVESAVSGEKEAAIHVSGNDEFGQVAAAFNKLRSERDAYQLESELDKLTGLFNKKTIENLCRIKLNSLNHSPSSTKVPLALYVIDLDHFKNVNDMLGHQFGDKVLVEFAHGLRKIFRPNDFIGRFGGDEFVVVIDNLPNMEIVLRKAEQIKQIAYNLTVEGKEHFVTASIGIAICPDNGRDYDSLFAAADKAVYHVKNSGKNGYYCQTFEEDEKF